MRTGRVRIIGRGNESADTGMLGLASASASETNRGVLSVACVDAFNRIVVGRVYNSVKLLSLSIQWVTVTNIPLQEKRAQVEIQTAKSTPRSDMEASTDTSAIIDDRIIRTYQQDALTVHL